MHTIIGSGSIGQIVFPALTGSALGLAVNSAEQKKTKPLVSKVSERGEAMLEFHIGQAIIGAMEEEMGENQYRFGVYGLDVHPLTSSAMLTRRQKKNWQQKIKMSPGLDVLNPCSYMLQMEKADGDMHNLLHRFSSVTMSDFPESNHSKATEWLFNILLALRNVVIGLTKMHDEGYYHFDVKPANVLYFGSEKEPDTAKLCDFGLAKHIDEADFWSAPALQMPWHNFPPWTSYIALEIDGASVFDLILKESDIRTFFQRTDCERFLCMEHGLYLNMQLDIATFVRDPVLLFNAIDVYGMGLFLDKIYDRAPLDVQPLIQRFCRDAVLCSIKDDDVLSRWDEILYAF
jgi:serine/threonine protein kinase